MSRARRIFLGILIIASIALVLSVVTWYRVERRQTEFGVTFAASYTEYLGGDSRAAYTAILDDLGVKKIRLPVYWNRLEREPSNFDWAELDWQMDEAAKRGAKITLAIGIKVPRSPECHEPDWVIMKSGPDRETALLSMLSEVVKRYRHHPALERYQIENETFFAFGNCAPPDPERYLNELRLVRRLDGDHLVVTTVSGEQSLWAMRTYPNDIVGASAYRTVVNPDFGPLVFPIGPWWYTAQGKLAGFWAQRVILSEVQAEPWYPASTPNTGQDRYSAFTVNDLRASVLLAKQSGLPEAYLWGVEWWYDLYIEGDDRLWRYAQEIF